MSKYLKNLLSEKNIDIETEISIKGQIGLTLENVIEFIESMPKTMQEKVRATLVTIDFKNGNVMHYFQYLAEGMVNL